MDGLKNSHKEVQVHLFISQNLSLELNENTNIIHTDGESVFKLLNLMKTYNPEFVMFLNIDNNIYFYVLAILYGMKTIGISFNPFIVNISLSKRYIKSLIIRLSRYSKNLKKIFLIENSDFELKKLKRINELLMVPDQKIVKDYGTFERDNNKMNISIIGYIQKRKGVKFLLNNMRLMQKFDKELFNKIQFQIIGECSNESLLLIQNHVNIFGSDNTTVINKKFEENQFHKNIIRSDLILLLYKNHFCL